MGWLTGYVTTKVSVLDASGRVIGRLEREQVPIPPGGLPFREASGGQLIVADVGGREMILDSSEFNVRFAERLVEKTCQDLGSTGQASSRSSAASMGHGDCR